jgi:hypothetical protein
MARRVLWPPLGSCETDFAMMMGIRLGKPPRPSPFAATSAVIVPPNLRIIQTGEFRITQAGDFRLVTP